MNVFGIVNYRVKKLSAYGTCSEEYKGINLSHWKNHMLF